jgi:hypothetical protein
MNFHSLATHRSSSMAVNRVVRVHQHGGPEYLRLDELPRDAPRHSQLLVEVQAAGVNFFDTRPPHSWVLLPRPGGEAK